MGLIRFLPDKEYLAAVSTVIRQFGRARLSYLPQLLRVPVACMSQVYSTSIHSVPSCIPEGIGVTSTGQLWSFNAPFAQR